MKNLKRLLSALLCGCMLFSLAACGEGAEKEKVINVISRGRYVEKNITPENFQGDISVIKEFGEGHIDVITVKYTKMSPVNRTREQDEYKHFTTKDFGETWTEYSMDFVKDYMFDHEGDESTWPEIIASLNSNFTLLENGDIEFDVYYWNRIEETNENKKMLAKVDGTVEEIANADGLSNEKIKEKFGESFNLGQTMYLSESRMYVALYKQPTEEEYRIAEETNNWEGLHEAKNLLLNSETFEVVANFDEISNAEYIHFYSENAFVSGNKLYFISNGMERIMEVFDIDKGVKLNEPALSDAALKKIGYSSIFMGDDDAFYSITSSGVQRFAIGEDEPELVMEGVNYSFGSPINYTSYSTMNIEKEFLMAVTDRDQETMLMRYYYDADAVAETDSVLKVFSLYDSDSLRLALFEFKRQNPDVTLKVETGFTREEYDESRWGGTKLNEEDVIRALNIEILAGKGPDVFVLDNLPMESYIKQGVLEDLTKTLEDLNLRKQFIEGINPKNKTYLAPTNFSVQTIIGDKGVVENYPTLAEFKAAVLASPSLSSEMPDWETATQEEINEYYKSRWLPLKEEEQPFWNISSDGGASMFSLYPVCAPFIVTDDNNINEENLREYISMIKELTDKIGVEIPAGISIDEMLENMPTIAMDGYYSESLSNYLSHRSRIGTFIFYGFDGLNEINWRIADTGRFATNISIVRASGGTMTMETDTTEDAQSEDGVTEDGDEETQIEGEIPETDIGGFEPSVDFEVPKLNPDMIIAPTMGAGVYMPVNIFGVYSASENKTMAKEFVKVAYGIDVQKYNMGNGLPVLIDAFEYQNKNTQKIQI